MIWGILSLILGGSLALYIWYLIFEEFYYTTYISINIGKMNFNWQKVVAMRHFWTKEKHDIKSTTGIVLLVTAMVLLALARYLTFINVGPHDDLRALGGAVLLICFIIFSAISLGYLAQQLKGVKKVPASTVGIEAPAEAEEKGPGDFLVGLIKKVCFVAFFLGATAGLISVWYLVWFS